MFTAIRKKSKAEEIENQRKRFENYKLLSEVIKGFIEDFGKLVAIAGVILTILGNLGMIAYNANEDSKDETRNKLIESVPLETSASTEINKGVMTALGNFVSKHEPKLLKKVSHEIFGVGNITLLIISGIFLIPLFTKKKKQKDNKEEHHASANTNPDI